MTKKIALFILLGPLYPLPALAFTTTTSPNAYMVENTSGTSPSGQVCYDFITRPTCSAFIAGISSGSLPGGSTQYIQNTATPSTATQIFNVSSGTVTGSFNASTITANTAIVQSGSAGTSGQVLTSNGAGSAPTWQAVPGQNISVQFTTEVDSTTGTNTYGGVGLSTGITPATSSFKIKITSCFAYFNSNLAAEFEYTIFRDATNLATDGFIVIDQAVANDASSACLIYIDAPGDTSNHTYTIKARTSAGTLHTGVGQKKVIILEQVL